MHKSLDPRKSEKIDYNLSNAGCHIAHFVISPAEERNYANVDFSRTKFVNAIIRRFETEFNLWLLRDSLVSATR